MLKLTKRKDSTTWYIRGTVKGAPIYESTGYSQKGLADAYRLKRENELNIEALHGKDATFADAAQLYMEGGGEGKYLVRILPVLGDLNLRSITQALIDEKAKIVYGSFRKRKYKPSTIRRQFYTPVASVMHFAAKRDLCNYIRIEMPRAERSAPEWAEIEWLEKFWEKSDIRLQAISKFLVYTGCRVSECVNLVWEEVNLDERRAFVRVTKNGEHRTVYLPDVVIEALKTVQKEQGSVFGYKDRFSVNYFIKKACTKAKIKYLSSHKLGSHTYGTWMRRYGGADARGLVATGRWKDPKSTYIYTHARIEEEAKKADLLPTIGQKVNGTEQGKTSAGES